MPRQRLTGFCLMTVRGQTMRNNRPCFVWRFFSCQQSTYHTVTATSEREARAQLPDAPCLFAARIRLEGVRHA
ncbi:host cell division inhibitor Icd-like protein [Salmonella enterica subsp. diarizonae serovar 60:r:e,n,x,z15]|nr:host cell division inhibitor Icd-like protein [Salmonella enterica subsp. diarizonae serovar 60:r:e,n,x,z15]